MTRNPGFLGYLIFTKTQLNGIMKRVILQIEMPKTFCESRSSPLMWKSLNLQTDQSMASPSRTFPWFLAKVKWSHCKSRSFFQCFFRQSSDSGNQNTANHAAKIFISENCLGIQPPKKILRTQLLRPWDGQSKHPIWMVQIPEGLRCSSHIVYGENPLKSWFFTDEHHATLNVAWCFSMASHTSLTNMGRSWPRHGWHEQFKVGPIIFWNDLLK